MAATIKRRVVTTSGEDSGLSGAEEMEYLSRFSGGLRTWEANHAAEGKIIQDGWSLIEEIRAKLEAQRAAHARRISELRTEFDDEMSAADAAHSSQCELLKAQAESARAELQAAHDRHSATLAAMERKLEAATRDGQAALAAMEGQHRARVEKLEAAHQSDLAVKRNEFTAAEAGWSAKWEKLAAELTALAKDRNHWKEKCQRAFGELSTPLSSVPGRVPAEYYAED